MDYTIAICTYNGADRIPDVIRRLKAQKKTARIDWEVMVVDNNSTDDTRAVFDDLSRSWRDDVPLRYVLEERQGKSFAMERAVDESSATWIAFLDDDNLPADDWVRSAHRFSSSHPDAGAFGGQIHGLFETQPPLSFGLLGPLFALNERKEELCYSDGESLDYAAPGAGLVVRRRAWLEGVRPTGLDAKGPDGEDRGVVGEDFELQWRIHKAGWEIWHNPRMHLDHKIPEERFEEAYLKDFLRAIGKSRYQARMMRCKPWQRPFAVCAYLLADTAKILRLGLRYRSRVLTDKFVRGRLSLRLYMMLAPFRIV